MSRRLGFITDLFDFRDVDPESRNRVLLLGGIGAVVAVSLALIFAGYYFDRIASRGDTVFSVGERQFSYAYLEDRIDASIAAGEVSPANVQAAISGTVARIQTEELLGLEAKELGISVSDEELQQGIRQDVGAPEGLERNLFAGLLRDRLQLLGVSLDRFEEIVRGGLLSDKARADIEAEIPAEAEQVNVQIIQVATEEEAQDALERIQAGEDFAAVATEVSQHATAAQGGDYGWTPAGLLPGELDEAAFALEPDELSEVISNDRGFFILQSNGKEVREIDDATSARLVTQRLNDIIEAAREEHPVENTLTSEQIQRLAGHIGASSG